MSQYNTGETVTPNAMDTIYGKSRNVNRYAGRHARMEIKKKPMKSFICAKYPSLKSLPVTYVLRIMAIWVYIIFEIQIPITPNGMDAKSMMVDIVFFMISIFRDMSERPTT